MQTPWGKSDYSKSYGRGVIFYGTPSHGGFHVSTKFNKTIPDHLRRADGWYEEDCDWCLVATAFPDRFNEQELVDAKGTLKNWYPEIFEKQYNCVLQPGESFKKDEKQFLLDHANDYLALSAAGDWHENVPEGMVGVFAGRGGRKDNGQYPDDCKNFLVPEEEYKISKRFSFVIDPSRHQEIPKLF